MATARAPLPAAARRSGGRSASATAVVVAIAATAAAVLGSPPGASAQGLLPLLRALPPLHAVLLGASAPLYDKPFEAPFEFRFNAALTAAEYDCLPVYGDRDGYVPARGGAAPGRAPPANRTEDAVVRCHAGAKVAVTAAFFGATATAPLYAAAAGLGVALPRGCPPGTPCGDDGCGSGAVTVAAPPTCYGYHVIARAALDAIADDGFNADGRLGGAPYSDALTGYAPVNRPGAVRALLRWVPLVEDVLGFGTFVTQRFTFPQASVAQPALVPAAVLDALRAPAPYTSPGAYGADFRCPAAAAAEAARNSSGGGDDVRGRDVYDRYGAADPDRLCEQAAVVVAAVDAATEEQRVLSHWFDQKSTSLAIFPFSLPSLPNFSYADYLVAEMVLNAVNHDATRVVWAEKRRHDAARPASLLPSILRGTPAGDRFAPTLRTMPHPEYPSGSACICRAFGETLRAFAGDALPLRWQFAPGRYGPGLPSAPLTVSWGSIDELVAACGASRVSAGLHFERAVVEAEKLCAPVAAAALRVAACRAPGTPGLPPCEA